MFQQYMLTIDDVKAFFNCHQIPLNIKECRTPTNIKEMLSNALNINEAFGYFIYYLIIVDNS